MVDDLISAGISVALVLVVAFPLGGALKKRPYIFYALATALVIAHVWYRFGGLYIASIQHVIDTMNKGYIATVFFALVMFIGVLSETGSLRRRLQPIRAELSILAFIFALSHSIIFLPSYLPWLGKIFTSNTVVAASITVAILLVVVFAVLTVTSLRVARVRMPYRIWKQIQRLSYVMVALLYAHIVLALGRSAFVGHISTAAVASIVVYTVLGLAYAVLRIRKALNDRKRQSAARQQADEFVRQAVTEGADVSTGQQ